MGTTIVRTDGTPARRRDDFFVCSFVRDDDDAIGVVFILSTTGRIAFQYVNHTDRTRGRRRFTRDGRPGTVSTHTSTSTRVAGGTTSTRRSSSIATTTDE